MKDYVFDQSGLAVSKKSGSSRVFIYLIYYIFNYIYIQILVQKWGLNMVEGIKAKTISSRDIKDLGTES